VKLGALLLRGVIGPLFVGHGTQKLFGWFGGHGLEGTGGFFETLGLRPGRRHARAAGLAETAGGALVTLGALTPIGSTLISSTMITAIRKVHAKNGVWSTSGGYEYNLVLIAAATALVDNGAGPASVDAALFPRLKGPTLAVLSLAAAAAGSYLATSASVAEAEDASKPEVTGDPATPASGTFTRSADGAQATTADPAETT
jgi:putative oxidoreductase